MTKQGAVFDELIDTKVTKRVPSKNQSPGPHQKDWKILSLDKDFSLSTKILTFTLIHYNIEKGSRDDLLIKYNNLSTGSVTSSLAFQDWFNLTSKVISNILEKDIDRKDKKIPLEDTLQVSLNYIPKPSFWNSLRLTQKSCDVLEKYKKDLIESPQISQIQPFPENNPSVSSHQMDLLFENGFTNELESIKTKFNKIQEQKIIRCLSRSPLGKKTTYIDLSHQQKLHPRKSCYPWTPLDLEKTFPNSKYVQKYFKPKKVLSLSKVRLKNPVKKEPDETPEFGTPNNQKL